MELTAFNKLDILDSQSISIVKGKLSEYNAFFKTQISSNKGILGEVVIDKGIEVSEKISRDHNGMISKSFFTDKQLTVVAQKLGMHRFKTSFYDDNGVEYLTEIVSKTKEGTLKKVIKLKANTEIHKNNFTAKTDFLGRPISNEIKNIKISTNDRQALNRAFKDSSYKVRDQIGHLIADQFGGPASKENLVPQLDRVNLSKMKTVENFIRRQVEAGKAVDLKVESKYLGTSKRPVGFKITITVDGKVLKPIKFFNNGSRFVFKEPTYRSPKLEHVEQKVVTKVKEYSVKPNKALDSLAKKVKVPTAFKPAAKQGVEFATFTAVVSTASNMPRFFRGEISASDMAKDIASESGISALVGTSSELVTNAWKHSSHALFKSCAKSNVPLAVATFGAETYDSVIDFAKGKIDVMELTYNLGDGAVSVGGGLAGAALGAPIPVVGPIVGGMLGTVLATEAYRVAVEQGSKGAEILSEKASEMANGTIDYVKEVMPDSVNTFKEAFTNYANDMNIDFKF